MRIPIVAANWKMNKSIGDAIDAAAEIERSTADIDGVEIVICPPFTALESVAKQLRAGRLKLGAQNMHWEQKGAYTGEISAAMLSDLGCDFAILGHSERRGYCAETDEEVNRKAHAALRAGLRPIVCIGETLEQRDANRTEAVLRAQVEGSLRDLGDDLSRVVVAYEPVWAIGTGRTATPDQAQASQAFVRGIIDEVAGATIAGGIRIQYGGSVKPGNAAELFGQPDVDGGLIGGASLDVDSFVQIVRAALPAG